MVKIVDAKLAKHWLDEQEAVLVDVREPHEYETARIAGSHLIPLGGLSLDKLPPLGGKKLIIHCHLGKRSAMACEKLLREEPALEVYSLDGGIVAWHRAGY